ncbi:hypothetical protein BC827DRAFT_245829 [Russula dissimulans]|nr:hypothetical protein BC827DRAFT_245829 [Russula dissimulans]
MRNVILFIVAAAALVADAEPSTGHAHVAALLRRQQPAGSGPFGLTGLDPSWVTANPKCQSPCSPFMNTDAAAACFAGLSCLCGQQNYKSVSSCTECLAPSSASSLLN